MADENQGGEAEIAGIEQTMRSDYGAYQGNPGMQARYLELLKGREGGAAPAAPAPPAAAPAAAPAALPAGVAASANVSSHPIADVKANFEAEPELAQLLTDWGPNADANLQAASDAAASILNGMKPEAAQSLFKAVEDLPAADYADLMHQLAATGRARGTR